MIFPKTITTLILKPFRFLTWWTHLVPPIIGTAYLALTETSLSLNEIGLYLIAFVVSIIGAASFGYFLNDWSDIKIDRVAKKSNSAERLSVGVRTLLLLSLTLISFLPWIAIPNSMTSVGILVLLLVSLIFYSIPPFRFKERSDLGIVCDSLYGHILPVLIAITTFAQFGGLSFSTHTMVIFLATILVVLKGVRNILAHQIEDRKGDRFAQINTVVIKYGLSSVVSLLVSITLIETLVALLLALVVFSTLPIMSISFLVYLGLIGSLLMGSRAFSLFRPVPLYDLRFIMNDYYEKWYPAAAVMTLVYSRSSLFPILVVHLLLFPGILKEIPRIVGYFRLSIFRDNFNVIKRDVLRKYEA